MNRSKSTPILSTIFEEETTDMKKSNSSPDFIRNHVYKFSGRTCLGIELLEIDGKAVLGNIIHNSCAYKILPINYIHKYYIDKVNDFDFTTFNSIIKFINFIWERDHEITLEFKEYENHVPSELERFYTKYKLEEYIKLFYDLGVRTYEDLKYLEQHDLKCMNMPNEKIVSICTELNIKISNSIYLTDTMSLEERQRLIVENKKNPDISIYVQTNAGWLCIQ